VVGATAAGIVVGVMMAAVSTMAIVAVGRGCRWLGGGGLSRESKAGNADESEEGNGDGNNCFHVMVEFVV
jgi:hypothetical protein